MSTLVLALAVLGGTLATYLYDDESPLPARLAAGAPLGITLLGLAGFVIASSIGLTPAAVVLAVLALVVAGLAIAVRHGARIATDARVTLDVVAARLHHPDRWTAGVAALSLLAAWAVWRVFDRAVFMAPDGGISIGLDHNLGDLPFHLAIINAFVHGGNFPPEHPELAGTRLTYPFLADFVSAMLVRSGATLRGSMFPMALVLALSLMALLFRWAGYVTRDRLAAVITPMLVFLSGGLGFWLLLRDVDPTQGGLVGLLGRLRHDYTILATGQLRWGNLVTTMLLPQRSILLGMPLVVAVWTLWWQAVGRDDVEPARARRLMAGAGAITGLLPLVHAHALAVTLAVAAVSALLVPRREWLVYLAGALALAAPQVLWMARGSALQAGEFVGWQLGWDRGARRLLPFWIDNLGLFIPLLVIAVAWGTRDRWLPRRTLLLYLPFLGCFVVPNLVRLSPWIWDNIKFLVWWHVASAPLVALLLARVWRHGRGWRWAAAGLLTVLVLSGALDVLRVGTRAVDHVVYDGAAVTFGHRMRAVTPPGAIVLHAPTYNSEVYLAGRRSVMGYAGHTWSQGLDAGTREEDVRAIYAGAPEAEALLARHRVGFVLVGPRERELRSLDEAFFERFRVVAESAHHRLYAIESGDASRQ